MNIRGSLRLRGAVWASGLRQPAQREPLNPKLPQTFRAFGAERGLVQSLGAGRQLLALISSHPHLNPPTRPPHAKHCPSDHPNTEKEGMERKKTVVSGSFSLASPASLTGYLSFAIESCTLAARWKNMAKYGHIWPNMAEYGHIWLHMARYGQK